MSKTKLLIATAVAIAAFGAAPLAQAGIKVPDKTGTSQSATAYPPGPGSPAIIGVL